MSPSGPPSKGSHVGTRAWTFLGLAAAAFACAWILGLGVDGFMPRAAGRAILADLAGAAISPALDYEEAVPEGTPSFLGQILSALFATLLYAAAAMSLALPLGLGLGILSSDVAWSGPDRSSSRSGSRSGSGSHALRVSTGARVVQWSVRVFVAILRSVHELLWAVLFLAALGLAPASAVVAIALPFAGTIAKVYAEILDEAPRGPWAALDGLGATRTHSLLLGLIPVALPDLISYGFYRFECALRSAAVLGFFGAPTIGSSIFQSFENLQLREMWSYVYALIAAVCLFEWFGARLRKELR